MDEPGGPQRVKDQMQQQDNILTFVHGLSVEVTARATEGILEAWILVSEKETPHTAGTEGGH